MLQVLLTIDLKTMADLLTTSNILFALGIFGIVFSVFRYFRDPQVKSDKSDALMEQRMQYERDATRARFKEMQDGITASTALAQNHIHTVDTKVDGLVSLCAQMGKDLVKLQTIIDERIPKKI